MTGVQTCALPIYRKGESELLLKQVRQKLERGKSIPVIAEELETEVAVIEKIAERINRNE